MPRPTINLAPFYSKTGIHKGVTLWGTLPRFIPPNCHTVQEPSICIFQSSDKEDKCYPAIGTIARELKLSRSTVKRALADLEKSRYLRKEQDWRENAKRAVICSI